MGDKTLSDDILLQLLQCKSQIEQVKKAREECYEQMQTWWVVLYYINIPSVVTAVVIAYLI